MNTTVLNATPIAVTYRDGKTETVELRELTIRQLYKFIEHFSESNSPALAALSVGRDANWPDLLSDDSYGAVVKEAIRLNFPRAAKLISADITVAARLSPAINRLVIAEDLLAGGPSKPTSPAPVASVSPEATGSESST